MWVCCVGCVRGSVVVVVVRGVVWRWLCLCLLLGVEPCVVSVICGGGCVCSWKVVVGRSSVVSREVDVSVGFVGSGDLRMMGFLAAGKNRQGSGDTVGFVVSVCWLRAHALVVVGMVVVWVELCVCLVVGGRSGDVLMWKSACSVFDVGGLVVVWLSVMLVLVRGGRSFGCGWCDGRVVGLWSVVVSLSWLSCVGRLCVVVRCAVVRGRWSMVCGVVSNVA